MQVDAVDTSVLSSGKDEARQHRKQLNAAIDGLLRRTQSLYSDFNSLAEQVKAGKIIPPKRRRNDATTSAAPAPAVASASGSAQPAPAPRQGGGRIKIPIGGPTVVIPPAEPAPVKTGKIKIVIQDGSAPAQPNAASNAGADTKAPTPKSGKRTPKSTPKADNPASTATPVSSNPESSVVANTETPKSTVSEDGSASEREEGEAGNKPTSTTGPRLSREEFLARRKERRRLAKQRKAEARAQQKEGGAQADTPAAETQEGEEQGTATTNSNGAAVQETRPKNRNSNKRRGPPKSK